MNQIDARPLAPRQLCPDALEHGLRVFTTSCVSFLADFNLNVTKAAVQMICVAHRFGVRVVSTEGTAIGSQSLLPFLSTWGWWLQKRLANTA